MRHFLANNRIKLIFSILALCWGVIIWKGLIPGWSKVQSDFPNYYTASRLITEGVHADSIYHQPWFQSRIDEYGMDVRGKFSPFPPPTALVMLPFSGMSPLTAKRAWMIAQFILLLAAVALMQKISRMHFTLPALLLASAGFGMINNLLLGQLYVLLLVLMLAGYYYYENKKNASGIFLGFGIAIKYFPGIVIPEMLLRRDWKGLWSIIISLTAINLLVLAVWGKAVYEGFFSTVLLQHLDGKLEGQSPWAVAFQSWNSLLHNLFIYDPLENPSPLIDHRDLFSVSRLLIYSAILLWSAISIVRALRRRNETRYITAIMAATALLLAPASATYHGILMLFPAALIWPSLQDGDSGTLLISRKQYFLLLLLFLYGWAGPLLARPILPGITGLALQYSRLWLTGILWLFIISNSKKTSA